MRVRDNQKSRVTGGEFYMLDGITAAEDEYLQQRANALERQLFRRRIKDLAKTKADLRAALREEGLIRIRMKSFATSGLMFHAEAGLKLKTRMRATRTMTADEVLYGRITRAARKVGLKPGIEDVQAQVQGKAVEGFVNIVPFADLTLALDRMLARWVQPNRLKAEVATGQVRVKGQALKPSDQGIT
jgi:hypothetical protein